MIHTGKEGLVVMKISSVELLIFVTVTEKARD